MWRCRCAAMRPCPRQMPRSTAAATAAAAAAQPASPRQAARALQRLLRCRGRLPARPRPVPHPLGAAGLGAATGYRTHWVHPLGADSRDSRGGSGGGPSSQPEAVSQRPAAAASAVPRQPHNMPTPDAAHARIGRGGSSSSPSSQLEAVNSHVQPAAAAPRQPGDAAVHNGAPDMFWRAQAADAGHQRHMAGDGGAATNPMDCVTRDAVMIEGRPGE